jgi:hypothetical protein
VAVIVTAVHQAQYRLLIISPQSMTHRLQVTQLQLDLVAAMVGLVADFPYK